MALNSLKALSPAVECLPWVLDGVLKCIVTTSTKVFSLHIGSEPESAYVGCMSEWSINGSFWWAHNLCTDLLEVNCVVFNVSTERVLSIILSIESVSDNNLFLWVVLKLELNRRNINKKSARNYRDYNCIFWLLTYIFPEFDTAHVWCGNIEVKLGLVFSFLRLGLDV